MERIRIAEGVNGMRTITDVSRSLIAFGITLAMLFSTGLAFSGEATAEVISSIEDSTPPIPPYTIYGIIFDETGEPISNAIVEITNLRTGESLTATMYDGGAYEMVLEDLSSGYAIGDVIEIKAIIPSNTISKTLIVQQMGFGERVDIYFGVTGRLSADVITPALTSTIQSKPIERTIASHESLSSTPEPPKNPENSRTIVIDSPTDTPELTCHPGHPHPPVEYNVSFIEIRAPPYFRLAFTGPEKKNQLELKLLNEGRRPVLVKVSIFAVEPDGTTETFLKTTTPIDIRSSTEKTITVFRPRDKMWQPTQTGRNWIRGEIYAFEPREGWVLGDTFKESFNVVPGWRQLLELGPTTITEPTVWENLTVVINGDTVVNAPLYIRHSDVIGDSFYVNALEEIDAGSTKDIQSPGDGQYKVQVNSTGTLNVYGNLTNNPDDAHYWFYMNGTLLLTKSPLPGAKPGIVENMMGSPDLSQPGGIICRSDNVVIENGAEVKNGKTHGVYLIGSDAIINGAKIHDNGGDGISVFGRSAPSIEGTQVSWNKRYGVYVDDSAPQIKANSNISWNTNGGVYVKNVIDPTGQPTYVPGANLGYFIWKDASGWHMRMSSNGALHRFSGSVEALAGVSAISAVGFEAGDAVTSTSTKINFYVNETTGEDGLDFNLNAGFAKFDIRLDGSYQTPYVFIGTAKFKPSAIPFYVANAPPQLTGSKVVKNLGSGITCSYTNMEISWCNISSNGLKPVFQDDMESGSGSWTATGFWHTVSNESGSAPSWNLSYSGDWSWWYGINKTTTGNYDDGTRNAGTLRSPPLNITNATSAALVFWSWYETDGITGKDQRQITIWNKTKSRTVDLTGDSMREWTRFVLDMSDFVGPKNLVNISFNFDTIDSTGNTFQGWYIDDVEVYTSYPLVSGHGLIADVSSSVYLHNDTISWNNWNGTHFGTNYIGTGCNRVRMDHCNVSYNGRNGVFNNRFGSQTTLSHLEVWKNRWAGISLWYSTNGIIMDSNSSGNKCIGPIWDCYDGGISFVGGSSNNVTGCTLKNNRIGIMLYQNGPNRISNCTITATYPGSCLYGVRTTTGASSNLIRDCHISNSTNGFYAITSNRCGLTHSNVTNCSNAIFLWLCKYINVEQTQIWRQNAWGIYVFHTEKDHLNHTIPTSNTINGRTVYYFFNKSAVTLNNIIAGHITLAYCNNVTLRNGVCAYGDPISIWRTRDSDVINCTTTKNHHGMHIASATNVTIRDSKIIGNIEYGIYGEPAIRCRFVNLTIKWQNSSTYGMGMRLIGGQYNVIENCNASYNRVGISGGYPNHKYNLLLNNSLWYNTVYGLHTEHGDSFNTFKNNTLVGNALGNIVLEYINTAPPLDDIVSDNVILGKTTSGGKSECGVKISNSRDDISPPIPISSRVKISNNKIQDCIRGIMIYYSKNNTVSCNNISACSDSSIWVAYKSTDNRVYHNNLYKNAYDDNGTNSWDNGYPSGGNYWSTYSGLDLFSGPSQNIPGADGLGDTSYISGKIIDHYPLKSPCLEYKIRVRLGWNLISIPSLALNSTLPNVLDDIKGDTDWDRMMWYNPLDMIDHWKQFNKNWNPALNDLTKFNNTICVWLEVTRVGDGYIMICDRQPVSTSINLYAGWNMVGYPARNDGIYTVANLKTDTGVDIVEGFDETAEYQTKVLDDTYALKRGEGYWVNATSNNVWTVNW